GGAVSGIGRLLTVLVRVIALSVRIVRVLPVLVGIVLALPVGVLTLAVGGLALPVLALSVRILALGVLTVGVLVLPRLRTVGLRLTAGGAERLLRTVLLSAGLGPVLRRLLPRVRVASVVGRARRLVVRVLTVRMRTG